MLEIIKKVNIEFPDIMEREMGHVTGGGVAGDSPTHNTHSCDHRPMKGKYMMLRSGDRPLRGENM